MPLPPSARETDDAWLEAYLHHVGQMAEPSLRAALLDDVDPAHRDAVEYALGTGGKRLRPALVLLACEAVGGRAHDALHAAAALEVLHQYTLIVDDVIDGSEFRRGRPTVWKQLGRSVAACVGAHHAAAVMAAAARGPRPGATMALLAAGLKAVADGEIDDVLLETAGREDEPYVLAHRPSRVTEADWVRMAGGKSATLFAVACEVGAVCGGAPDGFRGALRAYGREVGLAFQAQDDLLDVFGDEARFGKRIGKDLLDRKRGNLVLLYALEDAQARGDGSIARWLEDPPSNSVELGAAIRRIEATGARERAAAFARGCVGAAQARLAALPDLPCRTTLHDVAAYVAGRAR